MKKEISYIETIKMIADVKKTFESQIEKRLDLTKVGSPLFIKKASGLQDDLSGKEEAVSFVKDEEKFEIVHSLAKWKREALGRYGFPVHKGLYTDMKAIRKDELVDEIHSLYVEQWDWECVIEKSDRTIEFLKDTVKKIYKSIRQTSIIIKQKYPYISIDLPKTVYFITSQELEDLYPEKDAKEREELIGREKKAVFVIGIGDKLKSEKVHDLRSPDYDDWQLDGDLLIYAKELGKVIEISSMGIRVDEHSLLSQLEKADAMQKIEYPYHQKILKKEIPYTIGGGIGQSRLCMLLLGKKHIAEVQQSSWGTEVEKKLIDYKLL